MFTINEVVIDWYSYCCRCRNSSVASLCL